MAKPALGLLGLSGISNDMRELAAALIEIRAHALPSKRLLSRAQVFGAYLAVLGGAEA